MVGRAVRKYSGFIILLLPPSYFAMRIFGIVQTVIEKPESTRNPEALCLE